MSKIKNIRSDKYRSTYGVWKNMKDRCNNPNSQSYDRYGGRGITICERWNNSFEKFYDDMGEKPKNKSIHRINNDEGYTPENTKWATTLEQSFDRGNPRGYTYHKQHGKYHVNIRIGGKKLYFGSYDCPEKARQVYLKEKDNIRQEVLNGIL